jgi:hypothetical protein
MSDSTTPAQPPFTITGQEHRPGIGPGGAVTGTWLIHFTTPSGVQDFISVDDADYNVDNVRKLLQDRVAQVEAVHALGQPPANA